MAHQLPVQVRTANFHPAPILQVTKPGVTLQTLVPKPLTPTTQIIPTPFPGNIPKTPTTQIIPTPFPSNIPKPMTPTRPIIPTTFPGNIPKPTTPTRPIIPTTFPSNIIKPTTPTRPIISTAFPGNIPKPMTPTRPIIQTAFPATITGPMTPNRQITLAVAPTPVITNQTMTFAPEMIDEDTIIAQANRVDQRSFFDLLGLLGDAYHNDEELVNDEIYDELVDIYEAKYGPYTVVGAEPTGAKVKLPYYLGSLRKLKEEKELNKWLEQNPGPYIIMDKIDGLSLLDNNENIMGRNKTTLLTRGGGYRGKDVTHLLPYINIARTNNSVRGEIVMTNEAFARVGAGLKNPRNTTSGIVNAQKQFNPTLARELSFYAYRIMNKNNSASQDIAELQADGFLVPNPVSATMLNLDILTNYYNMRKEQAPYEMDGLVIYQDIPHLYPDDQTPRHVVAFKTKTQTLITTVTHVSWRASKDKLLKPKVHYDTTNLSGADLRRASGYNARFIVNNNIGPGARILITRSGDVIPKILSVIEPAPNGPDYPDPNVHGNYDWNINQVELVVGENNRDVLVGKLQHFLNTLGVKNAGRKRVEAMVIAGITDIDQLLLVTPNQLASIPGIGPTLSNQFYNEIHERVKDAPLSRVMDASGIFPHVGERRFEMITDVYPDFLDIVNRYGEDPHSIAELIRGVKGFNKLADVIAELMHEFIDWLALNPQITIERPPTPAPVVAPFPMQLQIGQPQATQQYTTPQVTQQYTTPQVTRNNANNLAGMTVLFSGFRDKDLQDQIRRLGGKVTSAVSHNTTFLIMKNIGDVKGKARDAQLIGVPLISREDFIRKFLS